MKFLTGTRYSLPPDERGACKLDEGEVVKVRLERFFKGCMCVGLRKVSCIFFLPVGPEPWVYCSKSRFMDIVKWVEFHGCDFHYEFNLQYWGGMLIPLTDSDLELVAQSRRLAVEGVWGAAQGST